MAIQGKDGAEVRQDDGTVQKLQLLTSQRRAMEEFWRTHQEQIKVTMDYNDLILPTACVEKIIRAEDDGMVISSDTPPFATKLCELFIQELTLRAWLCAESHHRDIILGSDISEAIAATESYNFLVDVLQSQQVQHNGFVPRKRHMPELSHDPAPTPRDLVGAHHSPSPFASMLHEQPLFDANRENSAMYELMATNDNMGGDVGFFRNNNNNGNMLDGNNSADASSVTTTLAGPTGEQISTAENMEECSNEKELPDEISSNSCSGSTSKN